MKNAVYVDDVDLEITLVPEQEKVHKEVYVTYSFNEEKKDLVKSKFDNDNFNVINITLGTTAYSLEILCNNYIWHCCNNEWVPFGKRVEEC